MASTAYPKLVEGCTYRVTFTPSSPSSKPWSQEWTVGFHGTAAQFRAYVMRQTRHGRNTAVVMAA